MEIHTIVSRRAGGWESGLSPRQEQLLLLPIKTSSQPQKLISKLTFIKGKNALHTRGINDELEESRLHLNTDIGINSLMLLE